MLDLEKSEGVSDRSSAEAIAELLLCVTSNIALRSGLELQALAVGDVYVSSQHYLDFG